MSKQKAVRDTIFHLFGAPKRLLMLAMTGIILGGALSPVAIVSADIYTDQINQLNAQNSQTQNNLGALQMQAANYEDAINQLQAQIAGIQQSIADNQAKQADLEGQIAAAQAKLDQQRAGLSQDLKAMYVGGQMSTVEMLATSKSLSDYVDAETYSSAVQNKIQSTLDEITKLQNQLKDQQAQVEQLLATQQHQEAGLASAQAQQQSLLTMNQSQQSAYNNQLQANNNRIAQLRAEQAAAYAAYARHGNVSVYNIGASSGYPAYWANATQDTLTDSWGMYNRECVSYVSWKVASVYGSMLYWGGNDIYGPGTDTGGNAYQWVNDAYYAGIPVGQTPRQGSVVVWGHYDGLGWLGHVAYVELVDQDGSIEVSEYNFIHGQFSWMHVPASDASRLHYIYFHG